MNTGYYLLVAKMEHTRKNNHLGDILKLLLPKQVNFQKNNVTFLSHLFEIFISWLAMYQTQHRDVDQVTISQVVVLCLTLRRMREKGPLYVFPPFLSLLDKCAACGYGKTPQSYHTAT